MLTNHCLICGVPRRRTREKDSNDRCLSRRSLKAKVEKRDEKGMSRKEVESVNQAIFYCGSLRSRLRHASRLFCFGGGSRDIHIPISISQWLIGVSGSVNSLVVSGLMHTKACEISEGLENALLRHGTWP